MSFQDQVVAKRESLFLSILVILAVLALASACAPMRPSPFSEKVETNLTNSNVQTISQIQGRLLDKSLAQDPVRFALIADSHGNYKDLENTIYLLNQQTIDFAVHLGDMTDLGLAVEYDAVVGMMSQLQHPWLSVIGNHDAVGNGRNIFKRIFGEYNQSFVVEGYRFILFNNNKLDFIDEGIQLDWLEAEIQKSAEPVILFQHADPFNKENFNDSDMQQIQRILVLPQLKAVFHGHLHKFSQTKYGSTWIQQIHRTEGNFFALVELNKNNMILRLCQGVICEDSRLDFSELTSF